MCCHNRKFPSPYPLFLQRLKVKNLGVGVYLFVFRKDTPFYYNGKRKWQKVNELTGLRVDKLFVANK